MTIDEIKQALREMRELCANNLQCSKCPLAVGKRKHCPIVNPYGDAVPPCNWILVWPKNKDGTMRSKNKEE